MNRRSFFGRALAAVAGLVGLSALSPQRGEAGGRPVLADASGFAWRVDSRTWFDRDGFGGVRHEGSARVPAHLSARQAIETVCRHVLPEQPPGYERDQEWRFDLAARQLTFTITDTEIRR